jgi:hypothetical protein
LSIQEALQKWQCIEKMTEQSGSTTLLTGLEAVKLESIPTNAKTCLHPVSHGHMLMHFFKQSCTVRKGAFFQIKGIQA